MRSLLETLDGDRELAARLAEMPADAKTLTIELGGPQVVVHHPDWHGKASNDAFGRTIDLPTPPPPSDQPPGRPSGQASDQPSGQPSAAEDRRDLNANHASAATGSGRADVESDGDPSPDSQQSHGAPQHGILRKSEDGPSEGFVPPRRVATLCSPHPGTTDDIEYRLIGKLGAGGTGIVYQAHQRAIDREVAVKVLRRELASDPQSRRRFLSEARVIGSLDHPNVIALHDLCIDEVGQLFYSMKRIDGASWDQQIDTLDEDQNIDILLRVADAIRYAHSRGLVHRDLKPENVMLGRFGEVLVADWGLAIYRPMPGVRADRFLKPTDSAIGGTPAYMAPELAAGDLEAIGSATDVYLLGAILFRILDGRPPHHGDTLLACIRSAAAGEIVSTEVEGELMDIAVTAMAPDPAGRYASVDDLVQAIRSHREHEESERLVRRASSRLADRSHDDASNPYRALRVAEALLREAIEIWPDNKRASATLRQTQLEFARIACQQGDLDLALTLYESAGDGESEAAARVRRERDQRATVRESQAKYSALFTHSPEAGMLVRWQDGVVMEANTACMDMLGYGPDELVGVAISSLQIWACPRRRTDFIEQLARDGRIDNFETQFVPRGVKLDQELCDSPDETGAATATERQGATGGYESSPGGQADLQVSTSPPPPVIDVLISARTVDVNGEVMLMSTIRDISQRKAAERELEQSRKRLRDLQRLAGLGTWSFNVDDRTMKWSDEAFRLTGREKALGEPAFEEFLQQLDPQDQVELEQAVKAAIESAASYQLTVRLVDPDGQSRRLQLRGQPVMNRDGQVGELYGVIVSVDQTPREDQRNTTRLNGHTVSAPSSPPVSL